MDRTIARKDWSSIYPDTFETHGSFTCSDHCPVILATVIQRDIHKAFPFRFQNFWYNYKQVDHIVQKSLGVPIKGTKMFQVSKKLKLVKYEVKDWAKKQFGNFQDKIFMNEQKIEYVERKLLENPNSFRLNSWMTRLIKQREKMLLFKQKYWGKLSRNEWLVKGDRNTNFFQRRANARRKRKLIMKIKDDSGIWIEDHKTIADRFITEFMQRFKSSHNGSRNLPEVGLTRLVSDTDNDELIKLPSFDEIKNAVFSIDSNKTPGSDGFGAGFFKRYWETLQNELVNGILEFLRMGKSSKKLIIPLSLLSLKRIDLRRLITSDQLAYAQQFIRL